MAQPVLIDDGGSTRIKQLNRKMDDLIEVKVVPAPAQSDDVARGPFSKLTRITCLDQSGNLIALTEGGAPVPPGAFPIALAVGDSVVVFSGKHRLTLKLVNKPGSTTNPDCDVNVKATGGSEPIVEARHAKKQRRYIISNAPPIDKIEVNFAGPPPTRTFDVVQEADPPPTVPVPFAVYTMVVIE